MRQYVSGKTMKLSRTVAYALDAVFQLAETVQDGPVPCRQLATEGRMPERFLLQILRNLVNHGILASVRGVIGGYRLQRPLDEISLLELIEAVEGPVFSSVPVTDGMSEACKCRIERAMAEVARTTRRQLEAIKLSQLARTSRLK